MLTQPQQFHCRINFLSFAKPLRDFFKSYKRKKKTIYDLRTYETTSLRTCPNLLYIICIKQLLFFFIYILLHAYPASVTFSSLAHQSISQICQNEFLISSVLVHFLECFQCFILKRRSVPSNFFFKNIKFFAQVAESLSGREGKNKMSATLVCNLCNFLE